MIELNATLLAQVLTFLILAGLLRAFAYKPVVRMLKKRQDTIAANINRADADAAAAQATLKEYQDKLNSAREQAQQIVDEASRRAAEERARKLKETQTEIDRMKKAAKAEIERDHERAEEQLRKEVVELSIAAASKIISKNINTEDNERLVGDFLSRVDKKKIGDFSC